MTKPADLTELLAPVAPEAFFSAYWETKPLHIARGDADFYSALFTVRELDDIIASGHLRYPALQLAKGGQYFPPEMYTRNIRSDGQEFGGVLDLEKISVEYQTGATISLPAVQRESAALAALARKLEEDLDAAVQANVYLTPGGVPGFPPHYDTHEVFILQIGGRKAWRIYEPPLALPHISQPFVSQGYTAPATPLLEVEMNPGDLLYLPRGYVHATSAMSGFSAHVTIAATLYTWIELAGELLQSAKASPEFRKALPRGFAAGRVGNAQLREGLSRLLEKLQADTGDDLPDRFSRKVRAGRTRAVPSFRSDQNVIGADTVFSVAPADTIAIGEKGGLIHIEHDGKTAALPMRARPVVDEICRQTAIRPRDLSRLADSETISLVLARLMGCGVLRPR